jgi:hypothetical protein
LICKFAAILQGREIPVNSGNLDISAGEFAWNSDFDFPSLVASRQIATSGWTLLITRQQRESQNFR